MVEAGMMLVMFVIHEVIVDRMKKEALAERTRLIEMIQAKDLSEYKALNTEPTKAKEPKPHREELIPV